MSDTHAPTLPVGTELQGISSAYRIENVLEVGNTDITYTARRTDGLAVVIQEFFIKGINTRQGLEVVADPNNGEFFQRKQEFVGEMVSLAHLSNKHNLARILEVFECHGTVYAIIQDIAIGQTTVKNKANTSSVDNGRMFPNTTTQTDNDVASQEESNYAGSSKPESAPQKLIPMHGSINLPDNNIEGHSTPTSTTESEVQQFGKTHKGKNGKKLPKWVQYLLVITVLLLILLVVLPKLKLDNPHNPDQPIMANNPDTFDVKPVDTSYSTPTDTFVPSSTSSLPTPAGNDLKVTKFDNMDAEKDEELRSRIPPLGTVAKYGLSDDKDNTSNNGKKPTNSDKIKDMVNLLNEKINEELKADTTVGSAHEVSANQDSIWQLEQLEAEKATNETLTRMWEERKNNPKTVALKQYNLLIGKLSGTFTKEDIIAIRNFEEDANHKSLLKDEINRNNFRVMQYENFINGGPLPDEGSSAFRQFTPKQQRVISKLRHLPKFQSNAKRDYPTWEKEYELLSISH